MDLRRDTRGGESDDEERVRAGRETGGEKRLRMAREYLEGLEKEQGESNLYILEVSWAQKSGGRREASSRGREGRSRSSAQLDLSFLPSLPLYKL